MLDFKPVDTTDEKISTHLTKLLKGAVRLNSEFLSKWKGFKVEANLEFDTNWGLGSSSTLTQLVAEWADVHPMLLHFKVSNGSGYDVACADAEGPILYQVVDDSVKYEPVSYAPSFSDKLYFVHLNQKQSSDDAIKYYLKTVKGKSAFCKKLTDLTESIMETNSFTKFESLIDDHENLVSEALKLDRVQSTHFGDYWGKVKSLGAWGGDFVLVSSDKSADETKAYFVGKGFNTVVPYQEMVI